MTIEDIYGTRPDLLPRSLVRPTRSDDVPGRKISWLGREGVKLLDLADHLAYERQSVGRLPRASDGSVEWEHVTGASVLQAGTSTPAMLRSIGAEWISGLDQYVFFWGVLAAPSAIVRGSLARDLLITTADIFPDFWVFSPTSSILIESSFVGRVTVAKIST